MHLLQSPSVATGLSVSVSLLDSLLGWDQVTILATEECPTFVPSETLELLLQYDLVIICTRCVELPYQFYTVW